ncbi:MAG: flagellar basal body rod C-terminal domain-containing protein, partial [Candidatus Kapaibacterium sp.]
KVSGVNLDEEAANLIRFQQAYQASAKVMQIATMSMNILAEAVRMPLTAMISSSMDSPAR